MHVWANISCRYCIGVLSLFLSLSVLAQEPAVQIKAATLTHQAEWYLLSAEVDYQLTPAAKAAIQNSIPLFWRLKIQLKQVRLWHDRSLVDSEYRYRIRYHALLNSYSIKNETSGQLKKYASLAEALDAMSRIRDVKVLTMNKIRRNKIYRLAIRLEFDKEALPPPLRPLAYLDRQWDLSSDWITVFEHKTATPNL
jgi:hypothetical protein